MEVCEKSVNVACRVLMNCIYAKFRVLGRDASEKQACHRRRRRAGVRLQKQMKIDVSRSCAVVWGWKVQFPRNRQFLVLVCPSEVYISSAWSWNVVRRDSVVGLCRNFHAHCDWNVGEASERVVCWLCECVWESNAIVVWGKSMHVHLWCWGWVGWGWLLFKFSPQLIVIFRVLKPLLIVSIEYVLTLILLRFVLTSERSIVGSGPASHLVMFPWKQHTVTDSIRWGSSLLCWNYWEDGVHNRLCTSCQCKKKSCEKGLGDSRARAIFRQVVVESSEKVTVTTPACCEETWKCGGDFFLYWADVVVQSGRKLMCVVNQRQFFFKHTHLARRMHVIQTRNVTRDSLWILPRSLCVWFKKSWMLPKPCMLGLLSMSSFCQWLSVPWILFCRKCVGRARMLIRMFGEVNLFLLWHAGSSAGNAWCIWHKHWHWTDFAFVH